MEENENTGKSAREEPPSSERGSHRGWPMTTTSTAAETVQRQMDCRDQICCQAGLSRYVSR